MWQILSASQWRTGAIVYHGAPVLLASYVYPDARPGPMRRGFETLCTNFSAFDFRLVDRYLGGLFRASGGCSVELVESGLSVQFDDKGVFPGCRADAAWLELALRRGVCVVAITVGDWSTAGAGAHLRRQAGNRLCEAAEIQFLDRRTLDYDPRVSRYKYLATFGPSELPLPGSAVVNLDSNVLLDLEKAARSGVSPPLYADLRGLVSNIRYQDCRPGVAVAELCWPSVGVAYRKDRLQSLMAAMDAWFDDRSENALSFASVNARWKERMRYYSTRDVESELVDIRPLLAYVYCCLLKLSAQLLQISGFKAKQRRDLFAEYCEWMRGELSFSLSYPLQVAIDSLVGSSDDSRYCRQLLKFGRDVLHDIWGASWDLMNLMMADLVESGQGELNPFGFMVGIVTADKALATVRDRLRFNGIVGSRESPENWQGLMLGRLMVDKRLEGQHKLIADSLDSLRVSALNRLVGDMAAAGPDLDALQAMVVELEKQVIRQFASRP